MDLTIPQHLRAAAAFVGVELIRDFCLLLFSFLSAHEGTGMQRSMKSSFYLSRNPKKAPNSAATPLVPLCWVTETHNWNTVIDIFTIE